MFAALIVLGFMLSATPAVAAPMTSAQIDAVTNLLNVFGASTSTVASVQATLSSASAANAASSTSGMISEGTIRAFMIGNLRPGSNGDQVRYLQVLLAADSSVYPEGLITGFYGALTERAVKAFQKKYGLEAVGFIGPKTLKKLEDDLNRNPFAIATSSRSKVCAVMPPGHLIAPGWLKHHADDEDAHKVLPCQWLPPGIAKKLPIATSTPTTTTPDVTAPIIGVPVVNGVGTTSATVIWSTNESASGVVAFGTSTNYGMTASQGSPFSTSHSIVLTGLSASTTYHLQVTSADHKGNTATSSNITFTTATGVVVDSVAPTIQGASVNNLASTSASIVWATNEAANSKVYFGTTTPLVLASSTTASDAAFMLNHSLTLSALTASTTYYYVVESVDATGNKATTTQSMFTTSN